MTDKEKVALKYKGSGTYNGHDHGDNHRRVTVKEGGVVKVSSDKATQLQKDFPDNWVEASAAEAKKAIETTPVPGAPDVPAAEEAPAPAKKKGKK